MAKIVLEDIRKMSDKELKDALEKAQKEVLHDKMQLRTMQSHETKIYKANRKLIAQIKGEQRSRELKKELETKEA